MQGGISEHYLDNNDENYNRKNAFKKVIELKVLKFCNSKLQYPTRAFPVCIHVTKIRERNCMEFGK